MNRTRLRPMAAIAAAAVAGFGIVSCVALAGEEGSNNINDPTNLRVTGRNVLPSLSDAGAWITSNNAGPQVSIARQGVVNVDEYTGSVTRGDGRATDVTIQPIHPIQLVQGQRYQLNYDIRSDQLRDVLVFVQTVGKSRVNYFMFEKKRQAGIGYTHYEDTFLATRIDGRPALVAFGIGAYEGAVYLENVSLKPIGPPPPPAPANT